MSSLVQRRSTSNDVDQFVGDDSLSSSVVQDGVRVDHVTSVLRSVIHSVSSGRDLGGVTLGHSTQQGVGQGELGQGLGGVFRFQFIFGQTWGFFDGTGGKNRELRGLEGDTTDEFVVQYFGVLVVAQFLDFIGNQSNFVETWFFLTNTVEGQPELVAVSSQQLSLDLVADGDHVNFTVQGLDSSSGGLGNLGVDGTTQTFVGGDYNQQGVGLGLGLLGFGILVELGVGLVEDSGGFHGSLSFVQTGRGDDFHGVGDFFNILDGLETHLDFSQRGIVSGVLVNQLKQLSWFGA